MAKTWSRTKVDVPVADVSMMQGALMEIDEKTLSQLSGRVVTEDDKADIAIIEQWFSGALPVGWGEHDRISPIEWSAVLDRNQRYFTRRMADLEASNRANAVKLVAKILDGADKTAGASPALKDAAMILRAAQDVANKTPVTSPMSGNVQVNDAKKVVFQFFQDNPSMIPEDLKLLAEKVAEGAVNNDASGE